MLHLEYSTGDLTLFDNTRQPYTNNLVAATLTIQHLLPCASKTCLLQQDMGGTLQHHSSPALSRETHGLGWVRMRNHGIVAPIRAKGVGSVAGRHMISTIGFLLVS